MQVEMLRKILPPRMQNRRDADRAAEMTGIAPEGEQGVGGGAEEERVEHARIALREGVERVRQRKDDVEIRNRQQLGAPRREPPFFAQGLALGAMAVATGVVGDAHRAAPVTRLLMPAEDGGAAGLDGVESPLLDGGEAVRATIRLAMSAHDVRELQSRTAPRDRRARRHGAHGISSAATRTARAGRAVSQAPSPCVGSTESSAWSC